MSVPPAVAGGSVSNIGSSCVWTHPLPQVVLTSSKYDAPTSKHDAPTSKHDALTSKHDALF